MYSTNNFKTYLANINFNEPEIAVNEIVKLTKEVESQCPVSKDFGKENNKEALEIFLADELSANSSVQLQFIYSLVTYELPIPVAQFDKCPILLTQPEKDTWTPLAISQISM